MPTYNLFICFLTLLRCQYLYFSDEQEKSLRTIWLALTVLNPHTVEETVLMSSSSLLFTFYHTLSFCAFTINTFNSQQSNSKTKIKNKKNTFLCWERGIPEKDDALCVPLAHDGDSLAQLFLVSLVVLQHSAVSRLIAVVECWKSTQERQTAEGPGSLFGFQTPVSGKHIS